MKTIIGNHSKTNSTVKLKRLSITNVVKNAEEWKFPYIVDWTVTYFNFWRQQKLNKKVKQKTTKETTPILSFSNSIPRYTQEK